MPVIGKNIDVNTGTGHDCQEHEKADMEWLVELVQVV
jgi:hypothetical protein